MKTRVRSVLVTLIAAGVIANLAVPGVSNAEDKRFKSLTCVHVVVEYLSETSRAFGLERERLEQGLFVRLKAKFPRLEVSPSCLDYLYLNVNLGKSVVGSRAIGFHGSVFLSLHRPVMLLATGESTFASVWDAGGIQAGPSDDVGGQVVSWIDPLLDRFGAEYYAAGNK